MIWLPYFDFKIILRTCPNKYITLFIMSKGTVKFFNEAKGFGFIVEEGTNKEVFVHVSGLKDKITKDDHVEFNIVEGQKGINAVDVKKV